MIIDVMICVGFLIPMLTMIVLMLSSPDKPPLVCKDCGANVQGCDACGRCLSDCQCSGPTYYEPPFFLH